MSLDVAVAAELGTANMDEDSTAAAAPTVKRRVCTTCTTAKARCILVADGERCERCIRLGTSCVFLEIPSRKRRRVGERQVR